MLTVLGGLAEFERHLILARTSEGRQRAQQRGVRFGRKPSLTEHQRQEALARRAAGEALVDIARSYAVSQQHDLKARVIKWARPVFGVQSGPFTTIGDFATSDHGYGKLTTC
jgi:DNA invertase Pin-like site-specific DNA recombinase